MKYLLSMWKNCFNYTDRTSVKGYWMGILMYLLSTFILVIFCSFIGAFFYVIEDAIMLVPFFYTFLAIIPILAMMVRRLRDAGRLWTWLFISLIPGGGVVLLVFFCLPTNPSFKHLDTPQV